MREPYDRINEMLTENEKLRSRIRMLEMQLQDARRMNAALAGRLREVQDEQPLPECHH